MRHDRYVLLLTYADYRRALGGLERYMREETQLLDKGGFSAVCLFPFTTRRSRWLDRHLSGYWGVTVDGAVAGFYDEIALENLIVAWGRAGKRPVEIQLHNLRNLNLDRVRRFLCQMPLPVRLFLHDYATVCPKSSLLRNGEQFCGREPPSAAKCTGCVSWTPDHHRRIRAVLESVRERLQVVAPSRAARHVWLGTFPDFEDRVEIIPHLQTAGSRPNVYSPRPPAAAIRLAFLGAAGRHKGWEVFRRLAARAAAEKWPYDFLHLGWVRDPVPGIRNIPVSVVQDGPDAMIRALRLADIDIVFLWSLCPETYSYVLQECLLTNAMLVTNPDSGNIADTVMDRKAGRVFAGPAELEKYLGDVPLVRRDVDSYRSRPATLPDRLVPNDAILAALDGTADFVLPAGTGRARPNRLAGFLYGLKELKSRAGQP
ncbi:MAG: hypothetical protein KBC66_04870 [Kiritimatiellae bacterium]|jgi:hypothetical protein|nr:hypothetical protein [Kiritimatiellia bacterium]HOU20621.1 hypothetical protein [Kiritimatiellia bacterium]